MTFKKIAIFATMLVLGCISTANAQALNDSFAVDALRVLRMVQGEPTGYRLSSAGGLLVPRRTSEAVDNLDAEARTKDETATVRTLRGFFNARLSHNTTAETLRQIASNVLSASGAINRGDPVLVEELVGAHPAILEIHTKEASCVDSLESDLRSRVYQDLPACSEASLAITLPDKAEAIATFRARIVPR